MRYQILTTISVMMMVLIVCMQCSEGLDVCKDHDTDKLMSQLRLEDEYEDDYNNQFESEIDQKILQSSGNSIPLGPDRSTCQASGSCNILAPGPPYSRSCEEIYRCPQYTH